MKRFDLLPLFAAAAMAFLTACGGNAASDPADDHASTAALVAHGPAPVADCEAEGCNGPRVIDGLAEQYRSGAIEQQAQPAETATAPAQGGVATAAATATSG